MKIKFKKIKLSSDESYRGVIKEVEYDRENAKVRIFCELESMKGEYFMKSLKYSRSLNSPMGRFFEEMGALDDKKEIDLDSLVGCVVEVTLNKGKDGVWYVNSAWLLDEEDADDTVFDDEFDDGIDDIDFDEDEEE